LQTQVFCITTLMTLMIGCGTMGPNTTSTPETDGNLQIAEWRGYTDKEIESFASELDLVNWDDGGEISRFVFLNTSSFFPTATIHRGDAVTLLDYSLESAIAAYPVTLDALNLSFDEYVDKAALDGIVVLHMGKVVYEKYPRMKASDRHLLFSLSKVYVSTLVAILEEKGQVSTEETIDSYIPELTSSGWAGIRVRNILDMASGIDSLEWIEGAYTDPNRKHYQYEASLGWLPKVDSHPESVHEGSTYDFLASLGRIIEPGKRFEYVSVNSAVLGWLIEKITGKSFAEVLSDEIWSRIGAEDNGLVTVNASDYAAVHGGIVGNLRDVARFGLLFTPSHTVLSTKGLLPNGYLQKIRDGGRQELMVDSGYAIQEPPPQHVSYQWQVYEDGSFFKGGFGGQGLYVDPDRDIVLAFVGTHGFGEEGIPAPLEVCVKMFSQIY